MDHIDTSRNGTARPDDPYVAEYPGVCGGYPVIRETRIPVRLVVLFSRDGATVDELAEIWPTITIEQITGALNYYAHHPERVDEDVERHTSAALRAPGAPRAMHTSPSSRTSTSTHAWPRRSRGEASMS